ncbi:MAG: type II toxin-antitoxin system VapC family toxin, partial [Thermomicrobiales bacterium]
DSSALIAIIDSNDAFHAAVVAEVDKEQGLLIFPFAIVAEIAYFIERKAGQRALAAFIEDIMAGAYDLDYGENSWRRILELVRRYHDLPLGLADAAVIECAERHGGRVLTLDRRHFGVVEREGLITILP